MLAVPDEPIIPFIEGDGTGVDIWPAAKHVLDAAAAKHGHKATVQLLLGKGANVNIEDENEMTAPPLPSTSSDAFMAT